MTHKYKVGDRVMVGRHTTPQNNNQNIPYNSRYNWTNDMDQFVGKEAAITKLRHSGFEPDFVHYRIDLDSEIYDWREEALTLIDEDSPMTKRSVEKMSGMACCRCGNYNDYAEPNQPDNSFKCFGCRK